MPKFFSEHERTVIRDTMLEVGAELMKSKGIKRVSVEEVAKSVNIAKGTFYSFYQSREELLWDMIQSEKQKVVDRISEIAAQNADLKTRAGKIIREIYIKEDSIVFCLSERDITSIKRKLPPEALHLSEEHPIDINRAILNACSVDASSENVEILTGILDTLKFACTNQVYESAAARQTVLDILERAIVDFLCNDISVTFSNAKV